MKKILVIQTASIGDTILATAVLEKLHGHNKDAGIDILVRRGNEGIFEDHPFVRDVHTWDKSRNKLMHLKSIVGMVRKKRYDVVINLQRFFSTGLVTVLSGAKTKVGFDKNPLSFFFSQRFRHSMEDGLHEIQRNQSLIGWMTDDQPARPRLYPAQQHFEEIRSYQSDHYYCVAPGSQWPTKAWPKEYWVALISRLREGATAYLLGGADDVLLCDEIAGQFPEREVVNLAGKLSLLGAGALMAGAQMSFVNDSAPMHIASAMNAPVRAIFCSTVPEYGFGPLSDDSKVFEIEERLSCRPCGLHGRRSCPHNHFKCARKIKVETLI